MPTNKDIDFVKFLLDSTQKGNMQWHPTAQQDEFTTSLQGKYTLTLTNTGSMYITFALRDQAGQYLVNVNSLELPNVAELHEHVRRKALNVDSVLDNLMRGEGK